AEEMAQTLLDAISAEAPGRQQGQQVQVPGQVQQPGQQGQAGQMQPRSTALQFVTIDGQIRQGLRSGVLADVRITPDIQKNALVISAPAESMELIVALVAQLDQMPAAEVQIKVFQIVNGDVTTLITMLQNLFGQQANQQQQGGGGFFGAIAQQAGPQGDGAGLVPVRFSFDQRTNSIIASG